MISRRARVSVKVLYLEYKSQKGRGCNVVRGTLTDNQVIGLYIDV